VKSDGLHERLDREEAPQGPSDRKFAWFFALVFLALGAWGMWRGTIWGYALLGAGALFLAAGAFAPRLLAPLNRLWLGLGLVLYKVINPIVIALIMRMLGKDPLRRGFDRQAQSYWVHRVPPGPDGDSLKNQF